MVEIEKKEAGLEQFDLIQEKEEHHEWGSDLYLRMKKLE